MSVKERIAAIRLWEKIGRDTEYAYRIGVRAEYRKTGCIQRRGWENGNFRKWIDPYQH